MQEKLQIKIKVKIEGFSEINELIVNLPLGSRFKDLLDELVATYGERIRPYLYNTQTGELGVFMAIVNSDTVRLPQMLDYKMVNGDEVFIISPVGGG
jgi:molybdopterin converting factor small subunit